MRRESNLIRYGEDGPHRLIHRDGPDLRSVSEVRTSIARKNGTDTISSRVYVGIAQCDPELRSPKPRPTPHIVLAIHSDVHHVVMTEEQAVELGNTLIIYGRGLAKDRAA